MFKRRRDEPTDQTPPSQATGAAPPRPVFPARPNKPAPAGEGTAPGPQAGGPAGPSPGQGAEAGSVSGLGVPPRPASASLPAGAGSAPSPASMPGPASAKDAPAMARTPFNTPSPSPNQPPPGGTGLPPRPAGPPGAGPQAPHPQTPGMGGPPGGSAQGGSGPGGSAHGPAPRPQPQERRTLVVGRGISLNGTIKDAERLEVEGTVEAQLLNASELAVTQGGTFKGEVEVDACEIAGTMDGSVTARVSLVVRSTGRIIGTARCRRLQVEDGGQISGQIEMIAEGAAPPRAQD